MLQCALEDSALNAGGVVSSVHRVSHRAKRKSMRMRKKAIPFGDISNLTRFSDICSSARHFENDARAMLNTKRGNIRLQMETNCINPVRCP